MNDVPFDLIKSTGIWKRDLRQVWVQESSSYTHGGPISS